MYMFHDFKCFTGAHVYKAWFIKSVLQTFNTYIKKQQKHIVYTILNNTICRNKTV